MQKDKIASYRGFDTYTKTDHHTYVKENFKKLGDLIERKSISFRCRMRYWSIN
jgi:hypothetical protein